MNPNVVAENRVVNYPELGVIRAAGIDAEQFLQAQLTCDLRTLDKAHWLPGGYCDAKGKLWSVFRIFRSGDDFILVMDKQLLPKSLAELKKFSVFNKVEFTDESAQWFPYLLLGLDHPDVPAKASLPSQIGGLTSHESGHFLRLAEHVVLSMHSANQAPWPCESNPALAQVVEMQMGWPLFRESQQQEHIPQTLNLDRIGAISFKKGCYIGQETIARMHYKGQTKRRMQYLVGRCEQLPTDNDVIERRVGDNWRRAGAVLHAVRYDSKVVAVQAILPVDLDESGPLRIKGQDDSQFTPCPQLETTESKNESNH